MKRKERGHHSFHLIRASISLYIV